MWRSPGCATSCPTAGCCSTTCPSGSGDGAKVALVGANGAGKTTLLRIITGELAPHAGAVTRSGGLGVMRQMVGARLDAPWPSCCSRSRRRGSGRPPPRSTRLELKLMDVDDETTQMAYAHGARRSSPTPAATRSRSSGTPAARRRSASASRRRSTATSTPSAAASRSGWCWSTSSPVPTRCCCSTSRTTSSTYPGRSGSRAGSASRRRRSCSSATTASCSNNTATRVVTVELGAAGNTVWTHPGGFASYHEARRDRFARFEELRRRWDEEHAKLRALMLMYKSKAAYNSDMASRYRAAQTRLRKFEEAGPPTAQPREQQVQHAAQGRPHRQARGRVRGPRADRADEAVRPRGLVRRARRRARLQRLGQVALPAAARGRRQRSRRRAPAGR